MIATTTGRHISSPRRDSRETIALAIVSVLGLSFWFIVGFPFWHHNESYVIAPQLESMSFWDSLHRTIFPVANLRILGQGAAWLLYVGAGASMIPVQLFNIVVAVAAWVVLLLALEERRVLALLALAVGACLFPGYIYLFHLHGVFYSPLLLLVALSVPACRPPFSPKKTLAFFAATVLASLFHPYALLVFAGGAGASTLGAWRSLAVRERRAAVASLVAATLMLFFMVVLPRHGTQLPLAAMAEGWLASLRATELHPVIAVASAALTLGAGWGIRTGAIGGRGGVLLAVLMLTACLAAGIPLLAAWVAVCLVKALSRLEWGLAALTVVTALFPLPAATGSPTYFVFTIFLCTAVTATGNPGIETRLAVIRPGHSIALAVAAVCVAIALRSGIDVPFISRVAQPLLAERERTWQLQKVIAWLPGPGEVPGRVLLAVPATNPSDQTEHIDRAQRAPTDQEYFNFYLRAHGLQDRGGPSRSIVFGAEAADTANAVLAVSGRFAGFALIREVQP